MSAATMDERPAEAASPVTELLGAERRRTAARPVKILQIVTGWLLARWLLWLAARHLLGYTVESRVTLDEGKLRYHATGKLLGREIRSVDEVWLAKDLVTVGVERRFPHLFLLIGALGLLAGAGYGITAVIDGIQASYLAISLFGLGILAAGVLFDLALGALAGFVGGRSALLVTLRSSSAWWPGERFRIMGVDDAAARAFMAQVEERHRSA